MLRFFRKIRQNFLAQGRIGRYLSYAVGEIVLVVIGILIAVELNNWNEARKNRLTERAFVESFLVDLHQDIRLMDYVIDFNRQKIALLDSLLAFGGTDINAMPDQNRLYYLSRKTLSNRSAYQHQDRSLNKMANLGTSIIRPAVADSMALFQKNLQRIYVQSEALDQAIQHARDVMLKLFKYYLFTDPSYRDPVSDQFTGRLFPPIHTDVDLQDEFFNRVWVVRGTAYRYTADTHLGGHIQRTKRLIDFLEKEFDIPSTSP